MLLVFEPLTKIPKLTCHAVEVVLNILGAFEVAVVVLLLFIHLLLNVVLQQDHLR